MKTIVVLSDIHENKSNINKIMLVLEECDYIIFCGDGLKTIANTIGHLGHKIIQVRGNCDTSSESIEKTVEIEGVKIFITHGHTYGVKSDLLTLSQKAINIGVSLVFFGHTHRAVIEKKDTITLVNGGFLAANTNGKPTYAYVVVSSNKFFVKIVNII